MLVYILLQALRFILKMKTIIHMYWLFCFQNHILTPSIFDMPLLYSISSPKSMTDMRGSSNFRLSGRGGGRTESDRKGLCQLFGPQTCIDYHSTQINLVK